MQNADDDGGLSVLVVQGRWKELIAAGHKTMEIRGTSCRPRTVALAASGTQTITHLIDITGSSAVTIDQLKQTRDHCIPVIEIDSIIRYAKPHAWTIANVRSLRYPIRYQPKRGSVSFVSLPAATVAEVYEAVADLSELSRLFDFL